ncbi:hypothetical protein J3D47_001770 [Pseudomonas laurylsulfativorans]|uniref:hypothetical protein n=1 Tax=Pseudomonas laurylsulfativorans TaxID=1943631 RepID=UPI0020A1163F|nr:hypothetical protein [Pseudomonas laurylsulfativorans]MCP1417527.1 hypothetical protein [Pseudomonas laurylsulfativorans]
MPILESDWKKFKELRKIALDRFCQGVLADAKAIAQVFDDNSQSRSSALHGLSLMIMHDLLTEAELSVLSEDALSYIKGVVRRPYELEWVDEIVPQD